MYRKGAGMTKQERVAQQLLAECDWLERLARCQSGMTSNDYEEEESWASGGATAINPTSGAAPSGLRVAAGSPNEFEDAQR
jgi:hypothetical protein